MQIRLAEKKDVCNVIRLIEKRIAWMDEIGVYHWNKTNYLTVYPKEYFEALTDKKYMYVAENDGVIVGAIVLYPEDERWETFAHTYYIHHLVADKAVRGVGEALLSFSESKAKAEGMSVLRLDSPKGNERLSAFYEAHGYKAVGECVDGLYTGILREKIL